MTKDIVPLEREVLFQGEKRGDIEVTYFTHRYVSYCISSSVVSLLQYED